jgi:hypothetical protein
MAMALAAGVERYAIYKAIDEKPENGSDLYGLVRNDNSLKPGYLAYQVGATYFANATSAVYSWPGTSEVPNAQEIRSILASADNRPQFIWPAQVSQVAMERGPNRTTVVWNNSPVDITYQVPATANRATLVTKFGKTSTIEAKNGSYSIDLPGSQNNPDRRDYSIYLIGGDPFIIDEQVTPLPTDRVGSRIETVWPQGGADVKDATRANVVAQLLMPGAASEPVPCRYKPETVQLWRRPNGGAPELVGNGVRRIAEQPGVRYPVWDFGDVNVEYARAEGRYYEFYVTVDGVQTDPQAWTYGGPNATDWRQPPLLPQHSCA